MNLHHLYISMYALIIFCSREPSASGRDLCGARRARMMSDAALNHLSRSLVSILRHQARNKGIIVSDDGFARVGDVLRLRRLHGACRESIEQVVGTSRHHDGTPRFELRQNRHGEWLIRAMRHHSMAGVDPGAEPSDLDAFGAILVGGAGAGVAEQFRLRPSAGEKTIRTRSRLCRTTAERHGASH